ncbi:zinc finger protein 39-like [Cydia pomonella]|uniref:zinc finger protein 39-like n=1 Tax=Cydia pomonella TaxID=82600 RepID=UPI002ADE1D89|nr:zinc finger protein 39-like [Cydia pomonella]
MEEMHSCSCCLVRPPEKGLKTLYKHLGKTEIYYDMLKDCFDINLGMGNDECGICEVCVGRLRDASDFKLQVQRCQAEMHARLKGVLSTSDKFKIKSEKAGGDETPIRDIKMEKSDVDMVADGEVVSVTIFTHTQTSRSPGTSAKPVTTATSRGRVVECDICYKTFDTKNANTRLMIHRRSHTGEKPYACKLCNKRFAQRSHLNTHNAFHMGKFRFSCEQCDARFYQKNQYDVHMRGHTGSRPFSCENCKKSFIQKGHLTRHKRKCDPIHVEPGEIPCKLEYSDDTVDLTCDICKKTICRRKRL